MPSTAHRRSKRGSLAPLSTAIWFAVHLASSTVIAQVAPPLIPPVATGSTDVPYPSNASGDAAVFIELVVEPDGPASSPQAIEGAEPFANHARSPVVTSR